MSEKVYGIPCIFIVRWRGELDIHFEQQHIYQREVTVKLLEDMDIRTKIIGKEITQDEVKEQLKEWQPLLAAGKQAAFIIRKGTLKFDGKAKYENDNTMIREQIARNIASVTDSDPIVFTIGKASRELIN